MHLPLKAGRLRESLMTHLHYSSTRLHCENRFIAVRLAPLWTYFSSKSSPAAYDTCYYEFFSSIPNTSLAIEFASSHPYRAHLVCDGRRLQLYQTFADLIRQFGKKSSSTPSRNLVNLFHTSLQLESRSEVE